MSEGKNKPTAARNEEGELSRRRMLKIAASAAAAAPLVGLEKAQAAVQAKARARARARAKAVKAPLFFTPEEFAMVDELTELIIPADDHSPGSRAAQVARFIDERLAESFEEEPKKIWRDGLKLIDATSTEMHGKTFMKSSPAERIALLTRISKNEMKPEKPEEIFFKELKARTIRGYYTSKIGIHAEMEYKGNTYLKEFVGYS